MVAVLHIGRQQKNASVDSIAQDSNQGEICRDVISDTLAQEFKTPLSTMLGMLDLLLTTAMSLKQKEYLEVACSSGRSGYSKKYRSSC